MLAPAIPGLRRSALQYPDPDFENSYVFEKEKELRTEPGRPQSY